MRLNRRLRGIGRGTLVAACAALLFGALVPAPAQAATALDSDAQTHTVSLYANNAGVEAAGASVTVTISITNSAQAFVGSGTATVAITESPLGTRAALDAWGKDVDDKPATRVIATAPTQGVNAGATARAATVTIPAKTVGLTGDTAVYGLKTTVTDANGTVGDGYSTLTYSASTTQNQVGLAIAMPITVPATASGLIASDDLATYTATDGLLTRQLQLAQDHPSIAVAIDPMIIASIRVLGTSAPESARAWLDELDHLSNDSFPLQYGDADASSQLQAGIETLLSPTSFTYALDAKNFPAPLQVGETPQPTPTQPSDPFATPTPTPTQPATNVPTTAELLSWPYTFHGIAWPADDSLRETDIEALARNGYPSTIVTGSNTNQASLSATPNAPMSVKGGTALVTDQGVSTALRAVVSAVGTDEEGAALASASAQLAEISTQSNGQTIVLAGLDRDWPTNSNTASRGLGSVLDLPWVTASSLRGALTAPITSGLKLTDKAQDASRTAAVQQLIDDADGLDSFATVLADPTVLTGDTRNRLMSLLSVGWRAPDNDWATAVSTFTTQSKRTMNSVQILPTGKITVASTQSLIPVTVNNKYDLPVNVVLRATPSNGRLEVDSDTSKTIPAGASAKVLVPVKAKLGNGSVHLGMQLYSPTGVPIGSGTTAAIDVHADWEGLGALILGIAVVLFFGFGLTRSIVRRIRARGQRAAEAGGGDAPDAGDDGTSATEVDEDAESGLDDAPPVASTPDDDSAAPADTSTDASPRGPDEDARG